MKKNISKLGLLVALSILGGATLNSCRDAIDIVQDGELNSDKFFTSVSNMQKFLIGNVYNDLEAANAIYLTSLLTDEVKPGAGSGGQGYDLHRLYLDPSDTQTKIIWLQYNSLINASNRLIEGAKKITPSASEVNQYNKILAEAKTLRALAYLQLQTYFSEDMTNDSALGAIVFEHVPEIGESLPRSTNAQVYSLIESDLAFAKKHLKRADANKYYVNLNLVEAIEARLNLYRGKYAAAKVAAESVLKNSGLTLTQVKVVDAEEAKKIGTDAWNKDFYGVESSTDSYRNIWNDSNLGEVIFAIARPNTGTGSNIASFYNTNESTILGSPLWAMGRNLFNILNETPGDIRRYAYIDPTSKINPNYLTDKDPRSSDQLIIDKYPGKKSAPLRNDIKMFRLSEIYFILAEVAVEEGDLAKAKDYIQKVREARNYLGQAKTPNYTSKQIALADILKERRVELAFEGHRYIDLKRLAEKAGVTMDRNQTDDTRVVENLPNGSFKYTLPIPLSEIAGNPSIQQNKGY